jgi:TRAP-type C4-dicarboxylate transport system permease small subunit
MPETIKLAQNFGADKLLTVGDAANLTSQTTLPELIGNLIRTFIGLLGIIFLLLIVYAGYLWLTAQGDDDKVKHSKELLKNAVIGLIIISAAYAIAAFVINAVATTTNPATGA